jgi:DNA (cytosine-5)-methyltransferase 1
MRALSLYSGTGSMDLAAEMGGIEIVACCEPNPFRRRVLAARWPDKKLYEYDTEVTRERITADGLLPIDLVLGGVPCQPVSLSGKRLGSADPRFRWPEALRIVRELRPRWAVWENPPGLATVGAGAIFGAIQSEMAEMGYTVGWAQWGAADVGAPHRRERMVIVGRLAHTDRQ